MEKEITNKQRTLNQNSAIHLWCTQIAEEFNNRGMDLQVILKFLEKYKWSFKMTPAMVKEMLLHKIIKVNLYKEHTSHLTTKEVEIMREPMDKMLLDMGINIPFPSQDEQYYKSLDK